MAFVLQGGLRATGLRNVPGAGGALLVSNHLSFLDVFVLGTWPRRPLNFMARSSLFAPPLGPLIRSVGAFPIEREGVGKRGLLETIRRAQAGGLVALFPEGTRSPDGEFQPLKPGIAVLIGRAGVPVVPVGIAGAFEAWPRHRRLPRPHPIRVHYGPPMDPAELAGLDKPAAVARVQEAMLDALRIARAGLARDLDGRYDPAEGDGPAPSN